MAQEDGRIGFLKEQITKFEQLKAKSEAPERVQGVIDAYKEELQELSSGLENWA